MQDFEGALRHLFDGYGALEDRGHEKLGASKPLAARYAVERLKDEGEEQGWMVIGELAAAIRDAVQPEPRGLQ